MFDPGHTITKGEAVDEGGWIVADLGFREVLLREFVKGFVLPHVLEI